MSYPRRSRADKVEIGRPREERDLSDIFTVDRRFLQLPAKIDSNCDVLWTVTEADCYVTEREF